MLRALGKFRRIGQWKLLALHHALIHDAMNACCHTTLELLPERKNTLRCRHCHLTIAEEELADGFCPECFATSGTRRYDFDEVVTPRSGRARYRCEECGAIVESA